MVASMIAGSTPAAQPNTDRNSSPDTMSQRSPERYTMASVPIMVTASTGKPLAYEMTWPMTKAHTGIAKSISRWCGYTISTMIMVAVHAARNTRVEGQGRPA
jgi:hypothetical protein